jgi:RimJ/RimL family protein N-acetyltransferase
MVEITTSRAVARSFSQDDARDVFACISPAITRFMAWDPPATEADFATVWRPWLRLQDDGSELYLVVRQRSDGRCLGIVGVHALKSDTPELGIWLRHDVQGKGLGYELIGAVGKWVSQAVPVKYLEYPVAEENIASRRIAEAYGGEIRDYRSNPKYRSVVYHIPPLLA